MAAGEIRIQASAVGTRQDLEDILALGAAGRVHCKVATQPLSEANEVLEKLRRGQVSGRLVLSISP
jgi:propanol-preferring alcohol dehydrogenase